MNLVVTPLRFLHERLRSRQDLEHEQALLRITISALVIVFMVAMYQSASPLLQGLSLFLALAIALFVAICIWPAPNVPRRVLGLVADVGVTTWAMFLSGEYGASLVGVYLFITFGYGFRYGRRYLLACQALCVLGFFAVLLYVPYWRAHSVAGLSLLIALVVLPLYVLALLHRIEDKHAKTEQALKDCLERQGRSTWTSPSSLAHDEQQRSAVVSGGA
jgi:two-component system sensor histidine kinase RpfC